MKAQVIHAFGDPSVFTEINMPIPAIQAGQVLIKVCATSVNPIDCKVRSGAVSAIAPEFPAILHGDIAGVVEQVGDGVVQFKKGDAVYGCAGGFRGLGGALAEYMMADVRLIAKKPTSLSLQEAAALPLVGITAWMALFEKAKLTKGMSVLIHAGAGGVGHVAVQLAKWAGATVYATVRKHEDVELVKSFGADEVIHAENESVEHYKKRLTHDRGFDCVFDTVGGTTLDLSFEAAAINGTVVTISARSTHDLTPMHSKGLSLHCVLMLLPLLTNQHRDYFSATLEKIAAIVDDGKLKPRIDPHVFALNDVGKAHALLESGQARGKVVVSW